MFTDLKMDNAKGQLSTSISLLNTGKKCLKMKEWIGVHSPYFVQCFVN